MKTKKKIIKYTGRTAALIMCFIMIFGCLLPMAVNARENSKTAPGAKIIAGEILNGDPDDNKLKAFANNH